MINPGGSSRQRPGIVRRLVRWTLIAVVVMAMLITLVLVTAPGGRLIALALNRLGSGPGQSVEIDRIEGLLSGSTRIGHVLLNDASGAPWLLIKGIRVDWSPLALLSAGLAIDDVTIERVELARLPEATTEESADQGSFELPLAVNIKRFKAPDIVLGAPVAGRVARFEISGSLIVNAAISRALADLTLNRIDGVGGQFTIDADYQEDEDRFDVSARLSEPAGGVLAHLLKLAPDDAISLSATSQGSFADWRLSVDGTVNDEPVASADLKMVAGEAGDVVSLEASGAFERFMPPALGQIVEGRSELIAEGLIEPDRSGVVIDIFSFASARLIAQGRGRIARQGKVDLAASVSPRDKAAMLQFGETASLLSLSVPDMDVRVSGDAENASVRVLTSIPRVESPDFSADDVSAVVDFDQFSLATYSGSGQVDIDVAAVGSATELLARAVAGGVRIFGDVSLGEDGAVTSQSINISSAVANIELGEVGLSLDGGLGADVSASLRSAVLSKQAEDLLGDEIMLLASLSRDADGAARVGDFRLSSDHIEASGGGELGSDGEISADIKASLTNLAGVSDRVSGGLLMTAKMSGPVSAPVFEVGLGGDDLRVGDRDLSGLRFDLQGVANVASPRADAQLSGTLDGQVISGKLVLARTDGVVRIDPLRLQVASNLISGSLMLDERYRPKGVITLEFQDISSLSVLALQSVEGNGGGTIAFDVRDARSVADIALAFPSLSDEGFAIGDARAKLVIDDLSGTLGLSGVLDVSSVRVGETDISGLRVDFSQNQGWTGFVGKARAAGFPVALEGRVRPGEAGTELELAAGRTAYKGLPISLNGPARAVIREGVAEIERLVISPGGGEIAVAGSAGEALDLDVVLSNLPLSSVNVLAPGAGLSGTVSGRVDVTGTGASPLVSYNLNAANMRATAASSVADVSLAVNASGGLENGRLSFDARARGGGLAFVATGGVELAGTKLLSAKVNGTVPFSLLSVPLAQQGLALTGAATVDMSVAGTAAAPQISGAITTSAARLVDGRSGIAIDNLSGDIGLVPGQASIRSLSGELSSGGQISGSGTIGIAPGSGYPSELNLKIVRGRYADGEMVATRFDAELGLSGSLVGRPKLSGVVQLDETTISIPDTLPTSISQLDVTHTNAPSSIEEQSRRLVPDRGDGSSGGLGLDLDVQARRIFVRGRGLESELGGSVRLTGSTTAPVAAGGFDLLRGRLSVLGKRLDFDRGKLGFAGSVVPVLDFAASNRSGSTTATVLVTGRADRPEFSFTSSPELPEDEVLALLIFGRSLSDLSPIQIAQLAEAAGQLTGAVKGGGVVEKLRQATGVDDFDIRTDEDTGETSLGVGKYLNERTYLGLETGASAGSGKARIDLDIGGGIKLRGEADSRGETKGGIFIEREY